MVKKNLQTLIYSADKRLNPLESRILLSVYLVQKSNGKFPISPLRIFKIVNTSRFDVNKIYFYQVINKLVSKGVLIKKRINQKRFSIDLDLDNEDCLAFLVNSAVLYLTEVKENK